jgi:hypothetical protein
MPNWLLPCTHACTADKESIRGSLDFQMNLQVRKAVSPFVEKMTV